VSGFFVKTTVAVAAVMVLSASAYGQGAPLQITQAMDPPQAAASKPQVSDVAMPAAKRTVRSTAPKAVPVDAAKAASAAGSKVAPKPAAAKPAAQSKDKLAHVAHKPMPAVKKVRGKKKSANASPAPIDAIAAPETSHLTGDAAWAKLVGNSITGMYNGGPLVDAYLPGNVVKTKSNDGVQTGRWGLVNGKACFQYEPEPQATCYDVAVDGSDVTYVDPDGESLHFTLTPGIPPGL
jgi:hypothetical protein